MSQFGYKQWKQWERMQRERKRDVFRLRLEERNRLTLSKFGDPPRPRDNKLEEQSGEMT